MSLIYQSTSYVKTALKCELSVWDVYPDPHLHDNCLLKDLMLFRERAEFL